MATDKNKPTYRIKVLDLADAGGGDASFLVDRFPVGTPVNHGDVAIYAYLILGEQIPPLIVDTGVKEDQLDIMGRLGMTVTQRPDQKLAAQLGKYAVSCDDIRAIIHTHLHIDHAGNDDLFPNAKIIMTRKEIMFAVADIMGEQYPAEYITYLVEQIHVPGRVRLIDDTIELFPGILLEPTDAHTWGSLNVKVNTKQGLAIICGDVIYKEALQCRVNDVFPDVAKHADHPVFPFGDRATGNYWNLWAAKAGLQKVVAEADIILPTHDKLVVETYGYEIG